MTKFEEFEQVIARLRAPDGCPWDRAQTHASLKRTCIEEASEVICGINILERTGDPDNLKEELGDLLMQVDGFPNRVIRVNECSLRFTQLYRARELIVFDGNVTQ